VNKNNVLCYLVLIIVHFYIELKKIQWVHTLMKCVVHVQSCSVLVVITQQHVNARLYYYDKWLIGMFILRLAGVLNKSCGPVCKVIYIL